MLPEARVVRDLSPTFANASNSAYFAMRKIAKNVQKNFVRQLFYRLQRRDFIYTKVNAIDYVIQNYLRNELGSDEYRSDIFTN